MSDEKPLEKYTVKQLKEMARKIEGVEGVSVMKKEELLDAIKAAKGMPEEETKSPSNQTIAAVKGTIKNLKEKRQESLTEKNKVVAGRLKRRIKKLKKKTQKMARSFTS
jgi:hypothetical protein